MDYSKKVAVKSGPDQEGENGVQADAAAASPSSVELPEGAHPCPACAMVLSSSRELTNHLRSHNSPRSTDSSGEDEYSCAVCNKVLSSASSLDRHVLVHSGERPFKCKHCEMAFTTNGNMNRHLRTAHRGASPNSCTDSESSSDTERSSKVQHLEYNNNNITKNNSPEIIDREEEKLPKLSTKRKCSEYVNEPESSNRKKILLNNSSASSQPPSENDPNVYNCLVCKKHDFASSALLEAHLERSHPEFAAKCDGCKLSFKNHRVLNLHRFISHLTDSAISQAARSLRNAVVGFHDLTFIDFSSQKFPAIARAVCEKSLHRPASGEAAKFECSKCSRAFPCRSASDAHEIDCGTMNTQVAKSTGDSHSKSNEFFAGLDLQNKGALTEAKEGKDLADINSIISVTSGPIMQNFPRSDASTPESNVKFNPSVSSSGSSGTFSSEVHEEEAQDAFAAEFRKMKQKGEFPCRLCAEIFPNLRALKGHNRAHMGVGPGMPYPCNMCPYASTDKATLVRHLRSHNGDRPYECSLCNYAFTTKANCERHVRNRHGKLTREDIKSVLIYHPNEDSTNENNVERGSSRVLKDDVRKSLTYPSDRDDVQHQIPVAMKVTGGIRIIEEAKLQQPAMSLHNVTHYDTNEPMPGPSNISDYSKQDDDLESRSSVDSVSLVNDTKPDSHQRIQPRPMNLKKVPDSSENIGEEGPLDLSMDVLDLSKKSKENEDNSNLTAAHTSRRNQKTLYNATSQLLLSEALLNVGQSSSQPTSLEALYANAIYRNIGAFPGGAGTAVLSPYMFNPHVFGQDFSVKERLQKDLVRGLQLTSGGTLVQPTASGTNLTVHTQARDLTTQAASEQTEYANLISSNLASKELLSNDKPDRLSSSDSVKMVIKNGVLMPKQKQKRYRTVRPFTCAYCFAKFTLRSNMDRHIKQQHPQYWSQRRRGGHSTRGRPSNRPTLLQKLEEQAVTQAIQSYSSIVPTAEQLEYMGFTKHPISAQVKYAFLAQQLKTNKVDNDSEQELVIDEDVHEEKHNPEEPNEESVLREQLEGTNSAVEVSVKEEAEEPAEENPNVESTQNDNDDAEESNLFCASKTSEAERSDENAVSVVKAEPPELENEKTEDGTPDLASVSELLDNASQQYHQFQPQYLSDEEGLVASNSDCNNSGSDEKSDSVTSINSVNTSLKKKKKKKKKSAYSLAPNRVICPYCERPFPWTSSLRRHILTHTGQKPYQCVHCSLLFTTKSNCDRHLLRKHKANPNKVRRVRNSSSPDSQAVNNNNNSFAMRNVPERPYKCNECPSSTFSTLGNLKKHRTTKHANNVSSRPESPCSEPQNSPQECSKQNNEQSDYDSQSSSVSEGLETSSVAELPKDTTNTPPSFTNETPKSRKSSPRSSPAPSDLPFKCHLCDSGFAERQDCLIHIETNHKESYDMLVAKKALDTETSSVKDQPLPPPPQSQQTSDGEEKKGRFPDYSNRKVVCAFCMRRFWSAEDLRRHMRTHSGERPFFCDICTRRFTLKHSMLRHRKKHESLDSTMHVGTSGDEENSPAQLSITTPGTPQQPPILMPGNSGNPRHQDRISSPAVASIATGDTPTSGSVRFNPYDRLISLTGKLARIPQDQNVDMTESVDNDLISNLLGIRDKSFIDRVLQASADDAAKLLGVNHSHE